jgi:hypothetical protein
MRCYLILIYLFFLSVSLHAQYVVEDLHNPYEAQTVDTAQPSKWLFGGNFFISFGDIRSVMLTPRVGYWLTNQVLLGGSYTYINWREMGFSASNIHGPGVFSMYRLPNAITDKLPADVLLNAEFDNLWLQTVNESRSVRQLFIGPMAFFRQGRGGVTVGLLYNVLHNPNTAIFAEPIQYRFGILF